MEYYIRAILALLLLLLLQTTFVPTVSMAGISPDLILPWLVIFGLRRGQIEATVAGFIAGLFQDVSATKFLGLAALAKTLAGFSAGFFFNENTIEQTLGSYRFVLIVGVASLVHNVVYFTIFFQGNEGSVFLSVLLFSVATTLYTCVVTLLPMFFFSQRYHTSWAQ